MSNLECSSIGDKRFSALYAMVSINGKVKSIETWYQQSKFDNQGNPVAKGQHVSYMIWNGKTYSPSKLSQLYKWLWIQYFKQNPDLIEYASQFDTFTDHFKGKAINSQADVIAELVKNYKDKEMN